MKRSTYIPLIAILSVYIPIARTTEEDEWDSDFLSLSPTEEREWTNWSFQFAEHHGGDYQPLTSSPTLGAFDESPAAPDIQWPITPKTGDSVEESQTLVAPYDIFHDANEQMVDVRASRTKSIRSNRSRRGRSMERVHACDQCDEAFIKKEHLNRHLRSVHEKKKPFPCSICGKGFARADNCRAHEKNHNKITKDEKNAHGRNSA